MSPTKKEEPDMSDWPLWSNHVLIELKRLNGSIDDLRKDLTQITLEVVQLKVKSSLFGVVSGAITVLMIFAISFVKSGLEAKPASQPPQNIYYSVPQDHHDETNPQSVPTAPRTVTPSTNTTRKTTP